MILAVLLGGSGPASGAAGSIVPADPPAVAAHTAWSGDFDLLLSRSLDAIRAAALRDLELEAAPVHAELWAGRTTTSTGCSTGGPAIS
jgi:hypothetical protein